MIIAGRKLLSDDGKFCRIHLVEMFVCVVTCTEES